MEEKNQQKDCVSEKLLPSLEVNTAADKSAADIILATQLTSSDSFRTGLHACEFAVCYA